MFFKHIVVLLFLFGSTIANSNKQNFFKARFDPEKWLRTFDLVNITADFASSERAITLWASLFSFFFASGGKHLVWNSDTL